MQNLAVPKNLSDPYLREWINTSKNPLISPTDKIDPSLFRDTSPAWLDPGEKWRLIIGSEIKDTGLAILYKSKDLYIGLKLKSHCILLNILVCGNASTFSQFLVIA